MDSILTSTKLMLGLPEDYDAYDHVVMTHINSVFTILTQLGIGPKTGYSITSKDNVWTEFISADPRLESVKSYMYAKVRIMFDPPSSSAVMEAMNRTIAELEWRLNVTVDPGDS